MRALLALVIAVTSFGALVVAVPAQAAADQPWSSYPSLDRDPLGANDWEVFAIGDAGVSVRNTGGVTLQATWTD